MHQNNTAMKRKAILLASAILFGAASINAQTSDAEADAIINLLGVQKRQAMAKLVMVMPKDSASFWKIYDEYQVVNKKEAKDRIGLYERTAMAYDHMSPKVADSLSIKYFANRMNQEKTLETFYNKLKTATNAVLAFQFYQAEIYMITQIRASIMEQIPTYGELQHSAKK